VNAGREQRAGRDTESRETESGERRAESGEVEA